MTAQHWPTGFMVLQSNRLEAMRDVMVSWTQQYPLKPLESEVFLVQSNGIAQWLKLALAAPIAEGGQGIAAAVKTELPGRFLWQAYRAVLPELPDSSPYSKEAMSWRLYRLLADLPDDALMQPLNGFLAKDPTDPRRRYQLALKLADLFDQYQVYRADWLQDWQAGQDRIDHKAIPANQGWQPVLWRLLLQDIQQAGIEGLSRSQVHQQFLTRCMQLTERPTALPRRVIVFGISSLPKQTLDALKAIAAFSQVLLFVNNPCQEYWGDLVDGRDLFKQEYRRSRRSSQHRLNTLTEDALHLAGHPLLASLGKQGRDYLHLLDELDQTGEYHSYFDGKIDLFESPGEDSILQQLQFDMLQLHSAQERAELQTEPVAIDDSLQFIRCHSPLREIEVLHDQLLATFAQAKAAGQPLQPKDVLVMVPDINQYAPYIAATFGRLERDDPRYLPFHIADQGLRHRNSLLVAFETLLALPEARFHVSDMLDFLDTPALCTRFALSTADLKRLKHWIKGANIRWGLDAKQRQSLGLPADLEQNSWLFGLKRMLLGYVSGPSESWHQIQPYDEVTGLDAALVGPLAQLLEQLQHSWRTLQQSHVVAEWLELLHGLLEQYFVPESQDDVAAVSRIKTQLTTWAEQVEQSGLTEEPLALDIVRDALLADLDKPSLQQRFLAGAVNFATLMPMRAIPFQQIWLLGMNDGDYPRSVKAADFDLMALQYRPGDRSRRDDDNYLFLEALLAARQKLVISWVGFSIRDNTEKPPSVLVGQLRDYLKAAYPQQDMLQQLTLDQPLQPFSRRYFLSDKQSESQPGRDKRLFSYAHEWRSALEPQHVVYEDASTLCFAAQPAEISLQDLAGFLRHPARVLLQKRLGVYLRDGADERVDDEMFQSAGLEGWALDDKLVLAVSQALQHTCSQHDKADQSSAQQAMTEQVSAVVAKEATRLREAGEFPLGAFGDVLWQQKTSELTPTFQRWMELRQQSTPLTERVSCKLLLDKALPVLFQDSLNDLRHTTDGQYIRVLVQSSRLRDQKQQLKWYHLCRYWPAHLMAQRFAPVSTYLVGPDGVECLPPVAAEQADTCLMTLLYWYQLALRRPLPIACKTALALLTSDKPEVDASKTYEGSDFVGDFAMTAEASDYPLLQRFWPDYASLQIEDEFHTLVTELYQPLVASLGREGGRS
ncbi:exodeoxyribonuclease V subunit gamma [Alkalimonas collagenimarina]|uniref:RecBCD enzyme subunit RecC n=1 Tax=Alkalimonas collagenimarina TaxID=400390 RepID=A0ABT9GXT1_9GAMM|nr:exodeoxyribonuclease V subunit gamma [Alkalimonas collagenimarina]MDP4535863.1 exodeoxyribonuclease V subunit gamma [Alkalimonas collagenimarina]